MSNGRSCFIRDLGPVKGGKGLKHHEVVLELSWRGLLQFAASKLSRANGPAMEAPETQSQPTLSST
jgi:hypothetical protein